MAEKGKEENRRHTGVWQGFLTQNFSVRTSRKIQDLIGGAIMYAAGGTRSGKICIEQADGVNYYSFCEDTAEPWMQYACDSQPEDQLITEQADGMDFVRIS